MNTMRTIEFFIFIIYCTQATMCLQCNIQGSCEGNLIDVLTESSVLSCLESCVQYPTCQWFTFNSIDNSCLLLENCPTITECTTCTSGEKDCGDRPILLIAGGADNETVELIDVRTGSFCQEIQMDFDRGFGAFVYGRPVLCEFDTTNNPSPCYELMSGANEWNIFTYTQHARTFPGHVVLPNGDFFIAGKTSLLSNDTSEILSSDNQFHIGPHLPEIVNFQCVVQWNETHTFFIGGIMRGTGYFEVL